MIPDSARCEINICHFQGLKFSVCLPDFILCQWCEISDENGTSQPIHVLFSLPSNFIDAGILNFMIQQELELFFPE